MSNLIEMAIAELVRLIVGAAALVFVGFLLGGVWGALGGVFLAVLFIALMWKMGDGAAKTEGAAAAARAVRPRYATPRSVDMSA